MRQRLLLGLFIIVTSGISWAADLTAPASWRPDSALNADVSSRETPTTPTTGEHPAVVALIYSGALVCTGTLVSPRMVLTARHCVGVTEVRFGARADVPQFSRRITGYRLPPHRGVDAALLELNAPVEISPLPFRQSHVNDPPRDLRIIGYGNEEVRLRGFRRILDTMARDWGCRFDNWSKRGCQPGVELVLPRSVGADTCQGDSGGPVLEPYRGGWRIVALTSRAVSDSILKCGDGGIYVRVDALANWINRELRADKKSKSFETLR